VERRVTVDAITAGIELEEVMLMLAVRVVVP